MNPIFVFVGPSCGGKTTLCSDAVAHGLVNRIITCTTRAPRDGEEDGNHYHFLSPEQFDRPGTHFVETATYAGHRYGTRRDDVEATLALGKPAAIVLDRNGAVAMKAAFPGTVLVGVVPPGPEVGCRRMQQRGIAPGDIRWGTFEEEVRWAFDNADRHIVTFSRGNAVQDLSHIIESTRTVGIVRDTVRTLFSM